MAADPGTVNGWQHALDVTPGNIDNFRQNRLRYVARDLNALCGVPIETTRRVLLARGVAKWMANRRALIDLKHDLKRRLPMLHGAARREVEAIYVRLQRAAKRDRWTLEAW